MKCLFLTIVLISGYGSMIAQIPSNWNGNFTGNIMGVETILTGVSQGPSWEGVIDASGYRIYLKGSIIDETCSGTMTDPQTQTTVDFRAQSARDAITIFIRDINPYTGVEEDMSFIFTKTADASPTLPSNASGSVSPSISSNQIDRALIGIWRFTDSYVSGDFSFATDYFMEFNGDGTALYTDGRTAGGGPTSSIDSGAGDVHRVNWKAENQVIYIDEGTGWQHYAKYYQENGSLMFTFGNGKRQVWEKIR